MAKDTLDIEQLQLVLEAAPTALLAVTPEGIVVFSNTLAESYFRYSRDEFANRSIDDLVPARFRSNHFKYLKSYFKDSQPRPMGAGRELFGLRKDGSEFPIEIGLNPIAAGGGILVVASIIDISDRKKSEDRYKLVIQKSLEGLLIASGEGEIRQTNEALNHMFGFDPGELVGQMVEVLLPEDVRKIHGTHRKEFLKDPRSRRMGIGRDLYGVRKDGTEFPVEVGLNPLATSDGMEIIVTVVDISSRRKLEQEKKEFEAKLQQTQKLESLGILAGGIAHDFNNVLTGIVGNAELAMMDLPQGSGMRRYLGHILEASQHAAELCDQMLAYSGTGKFINELFDVNAVIRATTDLINVSVSKNVSIKFSLKSDLPKIYGDATQIRQVVMNLIINASEAIGEESGNIIITTGMMDYEPGTMVGNSPVEEEIPIGRYVYIAVSDNGCGMDKATQQKIFDPFYSTKFTGRGLGLAAVLGIIHHHKGTIRIYSEEGVGTTFRVLLPFEDNARFVEDDEVRSFTNTGTVLIIDDEKRIHQVVGDTLKRVGFDLLHAFDGREGIEVFDDNKQSVKLIILDLTMPYLTGDEVYRRLRKLDDSVPVIVTSGYTEEAVIGQFLGRGIAGFLPKPVSPGQLLDMVKLTLDGEDGASPA